MDQVSGENEPTPGFHDTPYHADLAVSDPLLDDEALEAMIERRANEKLESLLKQKQEMHLQENEKKPQHRGKQLEEQETWTSLQVESEANALLDKMAKT